MSQAVSKHMRQVDKTLKSFMHGLQSIYEKSTNYALYRAEGNIRIYET